MTETQWARYDCPAPAVEGGDGGGYDYDIIGFFVIDGRFYMATTSGCSCTSPFDEIQSLADMIEVRSLADVQREMRRFDCWKDSNEKLDFQSKVKDILDESKKA